MPKVIKQIQIKEFITCARDECLWTIGFYDDPEWRSKRKDVQCASTYNRWYCSLKKNHTGMHVACGGRVHPDDHNIEIWDNEDAN